MFDEDDCTTCYVCLEDFEESGSHIPRILPCHHSLCEYCLVPAEAKGPLNNPASYRHHDENLAPFSDEEYFRTHGPITAIAVSEGYAAGQNNVVGIQVKYGESWAPRHGRPGNRTVINIEHDDVITKVEYREGLATDMIKFITSKGKTFGSYGNGYGGNAASANASGRPLLYIDGAVHSNNFNPDWNGTVWKLTFFFAKDPARVLREIPSDDKVGHLPWPELS